MVRTNKNSSASGRKRRASTPPPALPPLTLLSYLSTYKPSADAATTASGCTINGSAVESGTQNPPSGSVNVLHDVVVKDADFGDASWTNEGGSQRVFHGHHQHDSIYLDGEFPVLHIEDGELGSNVTISSDNAGKTAHTPKLGGSASNKKIKVTPSGCQDVRASHPRKSSMSLVVPDFDDDILPSVNVNKNKKAKSSSTSSTQPPEVAPIVNENPLAIDSDCESEIFTQAETRNDVMKFFKIYQQLRRRHDLNLQICQEHPQILSRIADMREMAAKLEADVKEQRDALDKSTKELRYITKKMGD